MNKIASAGKYVAYPEYKDSCVEWLGNTPNHWGAKALKFLCTYNDEVLADSISNNHEIEYVDIGSVSATEGITKTEKMMFGKAPSRARRIVRDGDVIISTVRTYLEAIAPIDNPLENLVVSTGFAVIRPNSLLHKRYAAYCLRAQGFIKEVVAQSVGISYPAINASDLVNIKVPEPSFDEQEKIANFLDHETAKIDTLIEKQKQLIKLLKEKRQAVISHAVTKGLNPNAQMRDSGVEWLDKVPEHWKVTRIKYHTNVFEQGWSPQCDSRPADDGEYGVLKVGCVNYGAFRNTENKALPKELVPQLQYLLKKDDLLISRANTKELVGSAAVVDGDYDNLILCDKLYRLRFREAINTQLVAYYLALPLVRQQIELEATGASHSMQNIGQATIKELPMVIPPTEEANELVLKIKEKIEVFDLTLDKANAQISLLQERRTALISAAVTGKIDVRHFTSQKGQVPKSSSQRVSK
jgi:type I restriction enzyme S subunit